MYPGGSRFFGRVTECGETGVSRPAVVAALICGVIAMTAARTDLSAGSRANLSASPLSGPAPLVVTFRGQGSGQFEGVMALDFGDGTTDRSISTIRGFERAHTYEVPGTYIAELKSGPYGGQQPAELSSVGRVTIVVN
jgi:PKD repeat protein